ncbi:hypothetical protein FZEAL_8971 [Fusarium zealandicum]|uniref:DUF7703 domain-containing protein n=1 Tax=Fusarium zealandicum TaxID=1053134 RepID=A0A8H4XHB6_9HYPO|nr:hypothetical protein FZEAL_8971 [Fusarium zealandicum]
MGYSGGDSAAERATPITIPIAVFMAISLYNVLELNVVILTTFKKRRSLYFWSFVAATNGIAPHTIGFLLKNLVFSGDFILYITLISVGWVMMVTGQSLVLYSRLHLVLWNKFHLRLVLAMIITNAVVLHIPIIILMYGSNSSQSNPWAKVYKVYEKIQVTMFFLQEIIISAIYIKACSSFFSAEGVFVDKEVRKMRKHLLIVNIIIILLDIPILALEYADLYDFQTAYKAIVYSIKLKLEFNILNRLLEMTRSNDSSVSRNRETDDNAADDIHMSTFDSRNEDTNTTRRSFEPPGNHGDADRGKGVKLSSENGVVKSTERFGRRFDPKGEWIHSLERDSLGDGKKKIKCASGLSRSSSEVNLVPRRVW